MEGMKKPQVFEDNSNTILRTSEDMDRAIQHTIEMIGPGYIPCLVCDDPTLGRGIYLPQDHREDLGTGEHFKNMTRIYSFALCEACTYQAADDQREQVRTALKDAVLASLKDEPETIN